MALCPPSRIKRAAALAQSAQRRWRSGSVIGRFLARLDRDTLQREYGVYISPKARLGKNLTMPHPVGIVVGDGVQIGQDVTLFQNVTLGRKRVANEGYPVLHDHVVVYAGAVILGGVTIGAHAVIAANSVVLTDIPAHSTAAGIPARVLPGPS